MTVSTTHRYNSFTPNGINLVFGFTFRCDDAAWISVRLDNVVVGGYTVFVNADQTASPGGTVTFAVAPVGTLLIVQRDAELTQETVYNPYGRFPAKSHETALDKLTVMVQDFAELAARVAKSAIGSPPVNVIYPPYVANKIWTWDPLINGKVINTDSSVEAVNAAAASAAAALASQNAAAGSANNAAASYDSFDDRYLGSKAAAPTLDNDGNALLVGALYWDSTNNTLNTWTGTAWTGIVLNAAGIDIANVFTQGQTITGANPTLELRETGIAANNGRWQLSADAESLSINTWNDAGTVSETVMAVQRTGTTPDSFRVYGVLEPALGQIKFPAVQNPSTDVNTLDDYEEGVFTPTLRFGGNSVGMTYSLQTGFYTKVGRLVTFSIELGLSAKGSSTGTATLGGLPFTGFNNPAVAVGRLSNITFTGQVCASCLSSGTTIDLRNTTEAGADSVMTDANFNNVSLIIVSGHFKS